MSFFDNDNKHHYYYYFSFVGCELFDYCRFKTLYELRKYLKSRNLRLEEGIVFYGFLVEEFEDGKFGF